MTSDANKPLQRLSALGQSVWVDFLSRESIRGGHLQELIDDYAVVGATSNPSIFEKAMGSGNAYDEQIDELAAQGSRRRGDLLGARPAGHQGGVRRCSIRSGSAGSGRDGYVSLEVDPRLAYDTLDDLPRGDAPARGGGQAEPDGQDPGDQAGARGDRGRDRQGPLDQRHADLLAAPLRRGRRVLRARPRAARRRGRRPERRSHRSRASSSRASTPRRTGAWRRSAARQELEGKLAIANAKLAYAHYLEVFSGPRWEYLAGKGATPQRVLWASTSTKNPAYPDISTSRSCSARTPSTRCPRRRSRPTRTTATREPRLQSGLEEAHQRVRRARAAGVDYDDVTDTLEREGVEKFSAAFEELMQTLRGKRDSLAPA